MCSCVPKVWAEFKFQSCTFSPDAYLIMISWEVCSIISTFGRFVFVPVNLTFLNDKVNLAPGAPLSLGTSAQTAPPRFRGEARASVGRLPLPFAVI